MLPLVRWLIVVCLGCVSPVLSGCGSCRDVSRDPEYLGSMSIGSSYELRADVFLYDVNIDRLPFDHYACTPSLWLYPPGDDSYGTPLPTTEEYRQKHKPRAIRGIVAAGTRLSLTKLLFHDFVTGAQLYYVFTIRSGDQAGKKVAGDALMTRDTRHSPGVPNDVFLQPMR
jgi:hypothetical protein